jgi:hypothetical protein
MIIWVDGSFVGKNENQAAEVKGLISELFQVTLISDGSQHQIHQAAIIGFEFEIKEGENVYTTVVSFRTPPERVTHTFKGGPG